MTVSGKPRASHWEGAAGCQVRILWFWCNGTLKYQFVYFHYQAHKRASTVAVGGQLLCSLVAPVHGHTQIRVTPCRILHNS